MKKHKLLLAEGACLVLAVLWFLFRPELLFIDSRVSEALPEEGSRKGAGADSEPSILAQGTFHSVAHQSQGEATVYQFEDGKRLVRFTNFETSNGPAVYVYLVAAKDANDSETVKNADTINLGALKGNKGDQNYDLPTDIDLGKYQAVTIWCQRFSVNFATAPLTGTKELSAAGQ
jgi:hypothetical protein